MRIAILANRKDSFVRPLAEGLARMAVSCGATPEIHYDGLETLSLPVTMRGVSPRGFPRRALSLAGNRRRFAELVERLRGSDVIVVVAHVPGSLARSALQNIEALRSAMPEIPVVNYDLVYLPTVEKWGAAMLPGEASGLMEADLSMLVPPPFVRTFQELHPQLLRGDRQVLSEFLSMVKAGAIHSDLHHEHLMIGR